MQVLRLLQKQLHWSRREQQAGDNLSFSSSPPSSPRLQIGGFVKQQASTSIFYVPIDDNNGDVSVISSPGSHSCIMEKNSGKAREQTMQNSVASGVNNDSSSASADAVKPVLLPKPVKSQKPGLHHQQQQQQQVTDSAINESPEQNAVLVRCRRGSLFPPCSTPAQELAQQTTSTVTKPLPPVCYSPVCPFCSYFLRPSVGSTVLTWTPF